jgi:hypothetical protein
MPNLTIEVYKGCPMWASNFEIASDSDDKSYLVQFHKDEPAMCQCPAYKFSGDYGDQNCKHIKRIQKLGCFYHSQLQVSEYKIAWNEFNFDDNSIKWLSWTRDVINPPEPCPGCGMPLIVMRAVV